MSSSTPLSTTHVRDHRALKSSTGTTTTLKNKTNSSSSSVTPPLGFNYHLHQRASSAERFNGNAKNHHQHHSPPPTTHNFRISLAKLLGNKPQPNSNSANSNTHENDETSRVIEALFPNSSFTIPSPMMVLQMERDRLEQEEERKSSSSSTKQKSTKKTTTQDEQDVSTSTTTIGRRGSLNVSGNFDDSNTSPISSGRRRRSSLSPFRDQHGENNSNAASKTPAVRRRSSVGSLIMSATDDLVGVSKPNFRRDSDAAHDDEMSSSSRRRRRSSAGSTSVSPAAAARRRKSSYMMNNNGSTTQFSTAKHLSITEESTRWGSEDLEVLRLLLRTIHTASGASANKRLLPSTGIAARVLLLGTVTQQLDAPANSIKTRITLGNIRNILGSQSSFDHVKINSPRSVTVVLRNGLQCDELIEQVSDSLNDRAPSAQVVMETKQLMAKLEYEYRSLCDTISRRDAIEFLRAPTVPEEACRPTQSEANINHVEATKRRGMMKLSRHQQETERIWHAEQQRIQKERMIEERLRKRQEELESRKQQARVQHSMNPLERNKPIVSYRKKTLGDREASSDDDNDDEDVDTTDGGSSVDENGVKRKYETDMERRARKEAKRMRRRVETRGSSSPCGGRSRTAAAVAPLSTTTEKVARVRAAREAIEREKLIRAHQAEAFRAEQMRECEDRKQQRFYGIAQNRASHNAHVRNAVSATRRSYEFEKIRRIADIENEEARMLIRKEQQMRMRERLREQLRVAQHLDLEAREVMQKGSVTLRQSLERLRTIASESVSASGDRHHSSVLANHFAREETQNAMTKIAQSEALLERKWQQML